MRLSHFTPRQRIPNVQATPRKWTPEPDVIIKHDDFYVGAWACEYEKPVFDSNQDRSNISISPEIAVRSDAAKKIRANPETKLEKCGAMFRQAYRLGEGTDTDHYV